MENYVLCNNFKAEVYKSKVINNKNSDLKSPIQKMTQNQ